MSSGESRTGEGASGPSSQKLKTDIANLMERADELAAHPLASQPPSITVVMTRDPESTLVTAMNIDWDNLDKSTWVYCAVLMRPMVFLTNDAISLAQLLSRIGEEHPALAGHANRGREHFETWQSHVHVGLQNLGKIPKEYDGLPDGTVTRLAFGDSETVIGEIDLDELVTDSQMAKIYLNGKLWHSDTNKAAKFNDATTQMKAVYAKCAEIRTLTAFEHVLAVREFIRQARTLGYDL